MSFERWLRTAAVAAVLIGLGSPRAHASITVTQQMVPLPAAGSTQAYAAAYDQNGNIVVAFTTGVNGALGFVVIGPDGSIVSENDSAFAGPAADVDLTTNGDAIAVVWDAFSPGTTTTAGTVAMYLAVTNATTGVLTPSFTSTGPAWTANGAGAPTGALIARTSTGYVLAAHAGTNPNVDACSAAYAAAIVVDGSGRQTNQVNLGNDDLHPLDIASIGGSAAILLDTNNCVYSMYPNDDISLQMYASDRGATSTSFGASSAGSLGRGTFACNTNSCIATWDNQAGTSEFVQAAVLDAAGAKRAPVMLDVQPAQQAGVVAAFATGFSAAFCCADTAPKTTMLEIGADGTIMDSHPLDLNNTLLPVRPGDSFGTETAYVSYAAGTLTIVRVSDPAIPPASEPGGSSGGGCGCDSRSRNSGTSGLTWLLGAAIWLRRARRRRTPH